MELDQAIQRLEELRAEAERERLIALAHQLEAWIGYLRMRPRMFSWRELEVFAGDVPPGEG